MLKLIGKINTNREELRDWCRDKIPLMQQSHSRYAKGRHELWLFHSVHLGSGKLSKAYYDERIWQFSQRVHPGCNIGLLTFGGKSGNTSSTGLITPHRDHAYARPIARTVNLGSCLFGYGNDQHQLCELGDGEIIEFNCKVLHSVAKILSEERFSITFWQLNEAKGYRSLI